MGKYVWKEGLAIGIRRSYRDPKNLQQMLEAVNVRCGKEGAYPYEQITRITSVATAFPFPQIFRGPTYCIAFTETTVHDISVGAWTASAVTLYNPYTGAVDTIASGGGVWHFAPFYKGWIASNGACTVFRVGGVTYVDKSLYYNTVATLRGRVLFGGLARWYVNWNKYDYLTQIIPSAVFDGSDLTALGDNWYAWSDIRGIQIEWMIAPHKAIDGGFTQYYRDEKLTNGDFSHATPGTQWTLGTGWGAASSSGTTATTATGAAVYTCTTSEVDVDYLRVELDVTRTAGDLALTVTGHEYLFGPSIIQESGRYVWYVKRSTGTVTFSFQRSVTAFSGTINSLSVRQSDYHKQRSLFVESAKTLDSGFRPMTYDGSVLAIRPNEEGAIIYGTGGITALQPTVAPIPTFVPVNVDYTGIAGRGAVGGVRRQVYIDETGLVKTIGPDLKVEEIGRKEIFELAINSTHTAPIVVSHDPGEDDFYITATVDGDQETYLLTATGGLSRLGQRVVSLAGRYNNTLVGFSISAWSESTMKLKTDLFDLETPGLKTITALNFSVDDTNVIKARVYYRYDKAKAFNKTGWETLDKAGRAFFNTSGTDFMVEVESTDYSGTRVHYFEVEFEESVRSLRDYSRR